MESTVTSIDKNTQLRRNAIGVGHIVFLVVAAAAPLTTVVSVSPAVFAFGNRPGVSGTFLLVGVIYVLFSAGFTTISRFVGNVGGFYSCVTAGLGRPIGVAASFIALTSYLAITVAVNGLFGFSVNDIASQAGGPTLHWFFYAAVLSVIVVPCVIRGVEFSGAHSRHLHGRRIGPRFRRLAQVGQTRRL